ncbi:MAG: hemopexin repeat-containing protein, partial [Geminicoccaceae bacterium]
MRFDRLDAALEGRREYAGNAYLFRGGQYTRFVWKLDREDFGYPISLSGWGLPTAFQSGVDAAINGQGAYADYAYFFKAGT